MQHKTCAGLALALAAAAATAQDAPEPPQMAACRACHGSSSDSDGVPHLAGQKADYLVRQLQAFRGGQRKHALMAAIAAQLGDAEIQALAQAWSAKPAGLAGGHQPVLSQMQFPARFPQGFRLYDSADDVGARQTQRRYANDIAWQAARDGLPLPAGAILLSATHALQPGDAAAPGQLLSYAGMEVQAGSGAQLPALLRNGDWQYALFDAGGRRREPAQQAACLACHQPLAADSHVFTLKALRAAARQQPR